MKKLLLMVAFFATMNSFGANYPNDPYDIANAIRVRTRPDGATVYTYANGAKVYKYPDEPVDDTVYEPTIENISRNLDIILSLKGLTENENASVRAIVAKLREAKEYANHNNLEKAISSLGEIRNMPSVHEIIPVFYKGKHTIQHLYLMIATILSGRDVTENLKQSSYESDRKKYDRMMNPA